MEMKLTKEGTTYTLVFDEKEIPPGREAENWCGPSSLNWVGIRAGRNLTQIEIAKAMGFDPEQGADGEQMLAGVAFLGLEASNWRQMNLTQLSQLLGTNKGQYLVCYMEGDHPDYSHYGSLGAIGESLLVLYDTQVDGRLTILRNVDFIKRWNYPPEDDDMNHLTEQERYWALIIAKDKEELAYLEGLISANTF